MPARAETASSPATNAPSPAQTKVTKTNERRFYIEDFAIKGGSDILTKREVERAVYPYMGPYRTADDVDSARAALEKAYHDHGFQTVSVQIPDQEPEQVQAGVITLQVETNPVGKLRVNGSRYFASSEIKREAPSLREGGVLDFGAVTQNLILLNQLQDRQVTPEIKMGAKPGTVDVDLDVKDTPPLHGSLEINNRYSSDTTPLRINGSADYTNLWQLGHMIGFSFQISPEDPSQVEVFSGYYLARLPNVDWLSLELQGTSQNSNVSTLAGIGVAGRGSVIGGRAIISLPTEKGFFQSVSLGVDYKSFNQDTDIAGETSSAPIVYFPFSAAYSAAWSGKGYQTALDSSVNIGFSGLGSADTNFNNLHSGATSSFIYFRGDLSHIHDLPLGFQVSGKIQGQVSGSALVNSEQFSGGGLDTVRGYLESEELGDNAILGSLELRTPSLSTLLGKSVDEWRFYTFGEGGLLAIDDALVEQTSQFELASFGAGTRLKLLNHYNGSLDLGIPLIDATETKAWSPMLTFRAWAEF